MYFYISIKNYTKLAIQVKPI